MMFDRCAFMAAAIMLLSPAICGSINCSRCSCKPNISPGTGWALPVKASTSCSSVHCHRSPPSCANFFGSVSPCRLQNQIECLLEEMQIKLSIVVSNLLGASGLRILHAWASTRSRVGCSFMRVMLRQIRCSPLGTKLKISSLRSVGAPTAPHLLKSCLRPRGARLENACAKCKRMWGLQFQPHRPPVLGRRFHHCLSYSLLPQPRQQAVQLARQGDESPPRCFLFRRTCIDHNYHQNFLVYVNPRDLHRFLLAWKRQNAREKDYTPSRATTSATRRRGATQIGSKRAFPIKLKNGLTGSRVQTDLRRPRAISLHAQCNHFHVNGLAEGPWELKTLIRVVLPAPNPPEIMTLVTFGIPSSPYIRLSHERRIVLGIPLGSVK